MFYIILCNCYFFFITYALTCQLINCLSVHMLLCIFTIHDTSYLATYINIVVYTASSGLDSMNNAVDGSAYTVWTTDTKQVSSITLGIVIIQINQSIHPLHS